MDFRDIEKEELYRVEGRQITVGSGEKKWLDAKPEELDLENGFFRREEHGSVYLARIDWMEVGTSTGTNIRRFSL